MEGKETEKKKTSESKVEENYVTTILLKIRPGQPYIKTEKRSDTHGHFKSSFPTKI